eukprot:GGOE01010180.1.p2 GENE.GGOE01010180.1~~GGOE01010180.1.p2  ORF type:complete len:251 (-),score=51.93 GGOE01010180.1:1361-2083(-)
MAPVKSVAAVSGAQQPGDAAPAKGPLPTKEPVDPSIRVCLDFLKGRCNRMRCKFLHPDLFQYQQLSGAVQAQAGRQICEVWAMTGQCKFGAKCNKLHPAFIPQPVVTLPMPVVFVPQFIPALIPSIPSRNKPHVAPKRPPPQPFQLPMMIGNPTANPPPPQHIMPSFTPQPYAVSMAQNGEADFQSVARSVLKALDTGDWEPQDTESELPNVPPSSHHLLDQAVLDLLDDFKKLCPPAEY